MGDGFLNVSVGDNNKMGRNAITYSFKKKPFSFSLTDSEILDLTEICKNMGLNKNKFLTLMIKLFKKEGHKKELGKIFYVVRTERKNYQKIEEFIKGVLEEKKDLGDY